MLHVLGVLLQRFWGRQTGGLLPPPPPITSNSGAAM